MRTPILRKSGKPRYQCRLLGTQGSGRPALSGLIHNSDHRNVNQLLVVTEDPQFAAEMTHEFDSAFPSYQCCGPALTSCRIEEGRRCPLLGASDVVVVDGRRGCFGHIEGEDVVAGEYASRLKAQNPSALVVVVAAQGRAGACGGVIRVEPEECKELLRVVSHFGD